MSERIGLIAGNGQFPVLFAKSALSCAREVVAIAVREETTPELEKYVQKTYWIGVGELKEFFRILKKEGLKKVVMAGQIRPAHIFDENISMDGDLKRFLKKAKDKRAGSLLGEIAAMLRKMGIRLLDSTTFLKGHLTPRGILTNLKPAPSQWQDIRFGASIARRLARLDVGQTVVVKDKAVLAVEAIEGTDETIRRGGALAGAGAVVVKVSRPRQDMRFDVPFVGPGTIDSLVAASCAVLAMQAAKTILFEKDACLKIADENNISLVGI